MSARWPEPDPRDADRGQSAALAEVDLQALLLRSDAAGVRRLLAHLLLIALAVAGVHLAGDGPLAWPAMLLLGVLLIALFAACHESVHRTAFASRWLNDCVSFASGLVLMLPSRWFRWFHLAHHRYTQDPARDPELRSPKPATPLAWLWQVSGVPYWHAAATTLWRLARGRVDDDFVPISERAAVVREARIYLLLYALLVLAPLLLGHDAPLRYWLLPVLLGQPFLRLFLMAEHTGCPQVPEMLVNTRTTLTNPLVRLLAWNMPFHAEHHLAPAVPFHALPQLHAMVGEQVAHRERGYLRFHGGLLRTLRG